MNRFPRHEQYGWACVGTSILIVPALLAVLSMAGCAKLALPVMTQTTLGERVVKTEVPRSGARSDVPAGVDPADVIVIETASGAKGYIAKKAKRHLLEPQQFEFYANEQAQAENMNATQPKPSHRRTWVVGISALLACGGLLFWGKIKAPIMALIGFFRRWTR